MFYGCRSLTTAPELPTTTLADSCYLNMYYACSALNSIKLATQAIIIVLIWVTGVASSGTFYYNGVYTAQDFQLPSGWETKGF